MSDDKATPDEQFISNEEYIEQNKEQIKNEIEVRVRKIFIGDTSTDREPEIITSIEEQLEKELAFAKGVLECYERWSKEQNVVVLWDIDGTMGHVSSWTEAPVWEFRPAMGVVISRIKEKYPTITNGIISNRQVIQDYLKDLEFFDPSYVYSSRGLSSHIRGAELDEIEAAFDSKGVRPMNGNIEKYVLMSSLKAEQTANFKIIDDFDISKFYGDDGFYCGLIMPRY